jgi:hypothetical protein
MIDTRECIEAFWAGQRPRRIPLTAYRWVTRCGTPEKWRRLYELGLMPVDFWAPFQITHAGGVERRITEYDEGGQHWRRTAIQTPVGEVFSLHANGWQQKYVLVTPEDYRVMTYVVEHSLVAPDYAGWHARVREFPEGVVGSATTRTPMQTILVDWTGLEQFAMHLYDFQDAVRILYDALLKQYREVVEIVAAGPGKMVEVLENFTAETMGPARFGQFHVPVYEELFPMLRQSGKIVATHFDGKLASCRELIARAPIDIIESLTPPPEGDMTLAQARAAWPEKLFWSNINVSTWALPPDQLRAEISRRTAEGSDHGARLAFEISEDRPANWEQAIPVALEALAETSA